MLYTTREINKHKNDNWEQKIKKLDNFIGSSKSRADCKANKSENLILLLSESVNENSIYRNLLPENREKYL